MAPRKSSPRKSSPSSTAVSTAPVKAPSRRVPSNLGRGSRGDDVKLIQEIVGAKVDGVFGPATVNKVKLWQTRNGITSTGVVDIDTINAMFR